MCVHIAAFPFSTLHPSSSSSRLVPPFLSHPLARLAPLCAQKNATNTKIGSEDIMFAIMQDKVYAARINKATGGLTCEKAVSNMGLLNDKGEPKSQSSKCPAAASA